MDTEIRSIAEEQRMVESRPLSISAQAHSCELRWETLAAAAHYRPSELAALCNVSLRTLERHFKSQYGTTLMAWMQELKLSQAYERVKAGESVKAVAYSLGFKQLSHFSRAFKTAYGVPPRFIAAQFQTPLRRLLMLDLPRTAIVNSDAPAAPYRFA
jgi:AraC-like DNA-binding protein